MPEPSAPPSTFELDARLQVSADEHGQNRQFPIGLPTVEGMDLVVGRSRSADLSLHDDFVSNRHLRILFREGKHLVEDLGSTHGTSVNDVETKQPTPLTSGDVIKLGKSTLKYICTKRPIAHLQNEKPPALAAAAVSPPAEAMSSPTLATKGEAESGKGAAAAAAAKAARKAASAGSSGSAHANAAQEEATRVDVTMPETSKGIGAGKVMLAVLIIASILALVCYLAWQVFFAPGAT